MSHSAARPVRSLTLTAKLKDTANASAPELSFQRKAVEEFHARQAQGEDEADSRPALTARTSLSRSHTSLSTGSNVSQKRTFQSITDNSDGDDGPELGTLLTFYISYFANHYYS